MYEREAFPDSEACTCRTQPPPPPPIERVPVAFETASPHQGLRDAHDTSYAVVVVLTQPVSAQYIYGGAMLMASKVVYACQRHSDTYVRIYPQLSTTRNPTPTPLCSNRLSRATKHRSMTTTINMSDGYLLPQFSANDDPKHDAFVVGGWCSPPGVEQYDLGAGESDHLSDVHVCYMDSPSRSRPTGYRFGDGPLKPTETDAGGVLSALGCLAGECASESIHEVADDKSLPGKGRRIDRILRSADNESSSNIWDFTWLRRISRGRKKVSISDKPDEVR